MSRFSRSQRGPSVRRLLLFVLASGLLLGLPGHAYSRGSISKVEGEFERAIRKITPTTVVCLPAGVDPQLVPQPSSGVIVSRKGHILSDGDVGIWMDVPKGEKPSVKHLRHAEDIEIRISDANGRGFKSYPAKVIRRSRELDTTLLKMEKPPSSLKYLSVGDSDDLRVGDFGFAMGNSFGLAAEAAPTLTAGIVSSLVPFPTDAERAAGSAGSPVAEAAAPAPEEPEGAKPDAPKPEEVKPEEVKPDEATPAEPQVEDTEPAAEPASGAKPLAPLPGRGGTWLSLYTSAAVNPGVNGGPFVDVHGRLVGTISSSIVFRGRRPDDPELAYSYLGKVVPINRLKAYYKDLPEYDEVFDEADDRKRASESASLATVFHLTGRRAYRSLVSLQAVRKTPMGLMEPAPPRNQVIPIPRYQGAVSGVLISQDGFILTSLYNLANISSRVRYWPAPDVAKVRCCIEAIERVDAFLPDGRRVPAKVVSYHEGIGLALLKAEVGASLSDAPPPEGEAVTRYEVLEPAPAERFESGNFVLALGNPFGARRLADPLLTVGVLSKQHAESVVDRWAGQWQTDAGVTDGNCGGAAVDIHGRLYGILTIWTSTNHGRNSGIGFIIPWSQIEPILPEMKRGRTFRLPYFGIGWQASFGPNSTILAMVEKDSPAGKAGLQKGDRILSINGEAVTSPGDVRTRLVGRYADDEVMLQIDRGGTPKEIKLVLGSRE